MPVSVGPNIIYNLLGLNLASLQEQANVPPAVFGHTGCARSFGGIRVKVDRARGFSFSAAPYGSVCVSIPFTTDGHGIFSECGKPWLIACGVSHISLEILSHRSCKCVKWELM